MGRKRSRNIAIVYIEYKIICYIITGILYGSQFVYSCLLNIMHNHVATTVKSILSPSSDLFNGQRVLPENIYI